MSKSNGQKSQGRSRMQQAKQDDPEQSKRFLEAAKEYGAAETEEVARRAFKKAVGKPRSRRDG